MVQPQNSASEVNQFLSLLSLDPQQMVSVETSDSSPLPPALLAPRSLHHLATHYLDFMSVPHRSFFELLALFASSEREKERLVEFSSTEGQVGVACYVQSADPHCRRTTILTAGDRAEPFWRF